MTTYHLLYLLAAAATAGRFAYRGLARVTQAGETLRLRGIVGPVTYCGRVRGSSAGSPADTALASRPQEGE